MSRVIYMWNIQCLNYSYEPEKLSYIESHVLVCDQSVVLCRPLPRGWDPGPLSPELVNAKG